MDINYTEILDNLPVLVYITSPNTHDAVFYNKTWYDFVGVTPDDM